MRRVLASLLLVTSALAGCLDGSVFENLRNDLEAEDEFEDRTLLSQEVEFAPQDILDPEKTIEDESDVSAEWNGTIDVPERTRTLTVTFRINFSTTDEFPQDPPGNPPDGEVRLYVEGPPGSSVDRNLTYDKDATAGFDFSSPEAGAWTVGMEARGQGSVTFNVHGIVPVNATGSAGSQ